MKHLWRTHHNISEEVCAAVCVGSLQNVTLQCFNGFLCLSLYVSEIRKGGIGRTIYLYRKSCMHLLHKILFNLILVETIPDDWFESARYGRRWWRFVSFCQCQRSRTSTNLDGRWQKWSWCRGIRDCLEMEKGRWSGQTRSRRVNIYLYSATTSNILATPWSDWYFI